MLTEACPKWDSSWLRDTQFDICTPEGLHHAAAISAYVEGNRVVVSINASYGGVGDALSAVPEAIETLTQHGFVCYDEQSESIIKPEDLYASTNKKPWWRFW
jgi:hypothetical protein